VGGIVDPRDLHRRRLEAAREAAVERARSELGEPGTKEERAAFDRRVAELVAGWTEGWEGAGLPRGTAAPWWDRLLRRRR
jgi:hypothetical protein